MRQEKAFRHSWIRRTLTRGVMLWNRTARGKSLRAERCRKKFAGLPAGYEGFRIVQITDLHGRIFGRKQSLLAQKVQALRPDLILITGDMMDEVYEERERTAVRDLYRRMAEIAPSYAILGNHETRSVYLPEILTDLRRSGVKLLRNESVILSRGEDKICLSGLETGMHSKLGKNTKEPEEIREILHGMYPEEPEGLFTILMAHKPEHLHSYSRYKVDLIFSGHAHGGLVPLRFMRRGLLAPGQGLFPKYVHGIYRENDTDMYVGRGLGGPRIGIAPEIVLMELHRA